MQAVSNTSPLIAFSSIGEMQLLRDLFETIYIPPAVVREIVEQGRGWLGARQAQAAIDEHRWLLSKSPEATPLLALLQRDLDPGEAEAIALAQTENLALLVDDREARKMAAVLGLEFFGTLGALKKAKLRRMISEAKPYVSKMRESGIYYADELIATFLADLGEL